MWLRSRFGGNGHGLCLTIFRDGIIEILMPDDRAVIEGVTPNRTQALEQLLDVPQPAPREPNHHHHGNHERQPDARDPPEADPPMFGPLPSRQVPYRHDRNQNEPSDAVEEQAQRDRLVTRGELRSDPDQPVEGELASRHGALGDLAFAGDRVWAAVEHAVEVEVRAVGEERRDQIARDGDQYRKAPDP